VKLSLVVNEFIFVDVAYVDRTLACLPKTLFRLTKADAGTLAAYAFEYLHVLDLNLLVLALAVSTIERSEVSRVALVLFLL